jgi:hypothetical protein
VAPVVERSSPGEVLGRLPRLDDHRAAHTGSGVVLGVIGWALALNFLQGGMPQVRKLLRAKFLNQTD